MTEQDKIKIALFFFNKHCSLYNRGKLYQDSGLKNNVTLKDVECAIKTDKFYRCGTPCDSCMRSQNGICTVIYNKNKECGIENDYLYWRFPYMYWNNVMNREANNLKKMVDCL